MPSVCARRARSPVEARVGVNTGEVVVRTIETGGHTEYTPVGHVTNLAARMQTAAPAGSIAASEATQRLCEGYFEFRALGPTAVKGLNEPVDVYEVVRAGPLRTHFQLSARRGLTKFVGRERELAADDARARTGDERSRADRRGRWPRRAPASRGCSTSSRRRCRPDARCSKPTRSRTARRRPGCRCSNCCTTISAFEDADDAATRREKVERQARRARPGARRYAAVPASGCSGSQEGPIRWPRWTRRSSAGARSTRSSASSCARASINRWW